MSHFIINGGKELNGTIDVRGSKNAALPMVAAALLTPEPVTLRNVPKITDVDRMIELVESVGATVERPEDRIVRIHAEEVRPDTLTTQIVRRLRSSVLLLGALLGRCGYVHLPQPGGCKIGVRSIATHLAAFTALGAVVEEDKEKGGVTITLPETAFNKQDRTVVLREFSVTGTENLLLLAATLPGITTVQCAAAEPHVQALARMITSMGGRVDGIGTHTLRIVGTDDRTGADITIAPDYIEAGTFLILGAISKGAIRVNGVHPEHLGRFLAYLDDVNVPITVEETDADGIQTIRVERGPLTAVSFETRIWPGIPTDLQAPLCVLATQADGTTVIRETLFEGRLHHLRELERMGADATIEHPHRGVIVGRTPLYAREITSFDLRAGATVILAALIANGRSIIHDIEQVDRGYENIDGRLQELGADIKRVSDEPNTDINQ